MPTELDSLQLNVTASTSGANTSIDNLIKKLNSLSQAIGSVNSAGFVTSMENMASAMNEIKNVADNTNAGNLKSIADGIKTLANSTKNISDGSTIKAFLQNLAQGMATLQNVNSTDYSGITGLFNSISKMGSGNVTNASVALPKIADALRQFQGIALPDFAGMESFTMFLRSLGSKTIVNAASALQPIVNALRQFETLNVTNISGIAELAQSLSLFGRASTQKAVTIIPQVATAFRDLIATLATAPTVSRNVVDLANALAQFVANVNRVGSSTKNATNWLNIFGQTSSKVSKKTFSLASAIGKLYATYFLLFRAFHLIKKSIDISSNLKEVQNVVDTTFGDMTEKVEEFASTSIESFGMSELSAKRYASRFQAMGIAMGITSKQVEKAQAKLNSINPELAKRGYDDTASSVADMSINITKLAADMASFYNVAQEDVAKDLESIWTGQTRPLRAYGLDLTNATLQEWAMKNGIEGNVKAMSQAQKTLLRYQYVLANTSAAQGDFTKTNLTWANQVRILAQNFERLGKVIGEGFIAWLRPVVVTINSYMDSIIASFQRVVNALGQIFGWQMIVDTTGGTLADDAEDIADGYDDATESAKKFKQQLLGIDELNNLTSKSGSGDDDDSGLGGLGGANIVNPGGISFVPYESEIKNLYDLGKKFSEGLKNLLPDSWEEIYGKAAKLGTGLADFLNGLIQPDTFYKLGQSLAGLLNSIKTTIVSFFTEANWSQAKESIKSFFEGFFGEIEISTIGLIIGIVTIKKIGSVIFGAGAIKAIQSGITKVFSSGAFTSAIASIGVSGAVAAGAVALITAGLGITYATNEDVRKSFAESSDTLTNSFAPALAFISEDLLPDIRNGFIGLFDVIKPIGDYLNTVFTSIWIDLISPAMDNVSKNIIPPLTTALTDLWNRVLVPLAQIIGGVLSPAIKFLTANLTSLWQKAVVPIAQAIGNLLTSEFNVLILVLEDVITLFGNLMGGIKLLWDASLKPLIDNLMENVKPVFDDVFGFIGDTVSGIIQVFDGLINFIAGTFTGDWKRAWEGIGNIIYGVFNALAGIIGNAINLIIDAINTFLSGINWATSGISELTGINLKISKIEKFEMTKLEMPKYEMGGFPEQGSLFVAGETYGQTEWIGNINGRTGVTSGAEITGIADAIYSTSQEEMELLRQQNQYLYEIMNKEFGITRTQIGREAQSYAREYFNQTGRQAFQV